MKNIYLLIICLNLFVTPHVLAGTPCQTSGSSVIFDTEVNNDKCRVTPELLEVNFYKIGVCNLSSAPPVVSDISGPNCSIIFDSGGSASIVKISPNNSTPITGGMLLPSPAPGTYNYSFVVIDNKLRFKQTVSFVDNTTGHNPVNLIGINPAHTGNTCWTTAIQYTMPIPSTDFTYPLADCGAAPDATYDFFTLALPQFDCEPPNGTGSAYYCGPADNNDKPIHYYLATQNNNSIIQSSNATIPNRVVGFYQSLVPVVISENPTTVSTVFTITNSVGAQFNYISNTVGYTNGGFDFTINVQ